MTPELSRSRAAADSGAVDSRVTGSHAIDPRVTGSQAVGSHAAESRAIESRAIDPRVTDSCAADSRVTGSQAVDPRVTGSQAVGSHAAESRAIESRAIDPRVAGSQAVDPRVTGSQAVGSHAAESRAIESRTFVPRDIASHAAESPRRRAQLPLAGKTSLVTGSTSGIGLGIAIGFAEQGASVLLNGFGDVDLARASVAAAANASGSGACVAYHPADLACAIDIEDLMELAARDYGGVDILVNNAGIQHVASVEDFPVDRWDAIVAINLTAAFHTTRLALPHMRARDWGRIINIASVHGLVASAHKAAYVAAKHGLVGLTKVTALETAQTGITCNALCPGWVLTPLVQQQVDDRAARDHIVADEARRALLSEKQPSASFVTAEQLAATALFLCSDAASQVRGAAWNVDGGWVAQ